METLKRNGINTNTLKLVFLFLIALCGIGFVYRFSTNIFISDEYDLSSLLGLYKAYHSGTFSFLDLYQPHNEHRIFFPNILFLIVGNCTAWNVQAYMYLSQFLLCAVAWGIWKSAHQAYGFNVKNNFPLWLLLPFLTLFNWQHYENFLFGLQLCFVLIFASSVFSIYFLTKWIKNKGRFDFFFAVLWAIIATFSGSQGILIWIVGIVMFVLVYLFDEQYYKESLKSRLKAIFTDIYLIAWIVLFVSNALMYFHGYQKPPSVPLAYSTFLAHPILPLQFVATQFAAWADAMYRLPEYYWGSYSPENSVRLFRIIFTLTFLFFAVISFFNFRALYRNRRIKINLFWIALFVNTLLFSILTTMGRLYIGVEGGLASRYYLFLSPIIISSLFLLFDLKNNHSKYIKLFKVYVSVVLFLLAAGYMRGWFDGRNTKESRKDLISALKQHPNTIKGTDYLRLYYDSTRVKQALDYMRTEKISLFK